MSYFKTRSVLFNICTYYKKKENVIFGYFNTNILLKYYFNTNTLVIFTIYVQYKQAEGFPLFIKACKHLLKIYANKYFFIFMLLNKK